MSIPQSFLDQLRERTTLSALIQRSIPLKRAGREWKACCPFHQEKSPSFHVNDEKGFYHCFGCGAHGDAIRWLTDHDGMPFIDAVKQLAAAAGMEVPASDPRAAERDREREGDLGIMDRAAKRFAMQLQGDLAPAARAAADYLAARGISRAECEKFGIGFAPGVPMGQTPFVAALDVPSEKLAELGLLKRNEATGSEYDFFRRRVVIPIYDARGRVIGFGGRIIGDGEPKYLNSPDTRLFDKGRTLFNLHRAAPAARAKNRLIIVEGYFDVVGMASVGIDECVAPNGTALTEAQLGLAWRLVDKPIVCLDGDNAGRAAGLRAAQRAMPILTPGKDLQFVFPPEGQDPDDIARKQGADGAAEMLASPISLGDLLWQEALRRMGKDDPAAGSAVRRELRSLIDTIKDQDVHQSYFDFFKARFDNLANRNAITRHRPAPARQAVGTAVEDAIFKGIIRHIDRLAEIIETISVIDWLQRDIAVAIEAIISAFDDDGINRGNMVEILERRGAGEAYRTAMSREGLRFPFLVGAPTNETFNQLTAALRDQATNRRSRCRT